MEGVLLSYDRTVGGIVHTHNSEFSNHAAPSPVENGRFLYIVNMLDKKC